MKVPNAGGIG